MNSDFKRDFHYIWIGNVDHELTLPQYLSIVSVIKYCKPNTITIWVSENITFKGKYYDMIKNYVNVVTFHRMTEFMGNDLSYIQRHDVRLESDIYRHLILYEYGGIYSDFDIIWCKDIDALLDNINTEFAISEQGIKGREGCNIGLLIGTKLNEYCKEFLQCFADYGEERQKNHTKIYTSILPWKIAKSLPYKVTILSHDLIHWPLYHTASIRWFYFSSPDDKNELIDTMSGLYSSDQLLNNYAHHCFGIHHDGIQERITEEFILNQDTSFTKKIRPILIYGKNNLLHTQ